MIWLSGSVKLLCVLSSYGLARKRPLAQGRPPRGLRSCPRLAPVLIIAPALRRLQTRFGGLDRRPGASDLRCNSCGSSSPRKSSPQCSSSSASTAPAFVRSASIVRLQASCLFAHPLIAHRLALARVRSHLRPVDRRACRTAPVPSRAFTRTTCTNSSLNSPPDVGIGTRNRAMLREVARREHPKRHILAPASSPPRERRTCPSRRHRSAP